MTERFPPLVLEKLILKLIFAVPIYKTKNENFFKRWSPEMAYVLGFFTADGNMIKNKRGAHFIEFQITDKELLGKIRKLLNSNLKISERKRNNKWKNIYRLQVGSKIIFNDLLKLGFKPNKSRTIKFPSVPLKCLPHFIRGYFDGDGCVSFGIYSRKMRKSKAYLLSSRFTSGNKKFLANLLKILQKYTNIKGGFIYKKNRGFELSLSIRDSKKLYQFMYNNVSKEQFLERKYNKFKKALSYWKN